jgi:hypothetical protein
VVRVLRWMKIACTRGPVAQSVEHLTFNQRVAGSSPARLTILSSVFPTSSLCEATRILFPLRRSKKTAPHCQLVSDVAARDYAAVVYLETTNYAPRTLNNGGLAGLALWPDVYREIAEARQAGRVTMGDRITS